MHNIKMNSLIAVALTLGAANAFPTPVDNSALIADLITKPTQIKRYQKLLSDPTSGKLLEGDALAQATIWDFNKPNIPIPGSQGGAGSSANIETFPFLINSGVTITMTTIGTCGVLLPHVHPRANEFFVVTEGQMEFGTLLETGLHDDFSANPEIHGTLLTNEGTLFPQGSVHYQVNNSPDCKGASVYAVLAGEDPGVTPILKDPLPGNATVGMGKRVDGGDFESVRAVTPDRIAKIVDACLARCGGSN